MGKVSDDVVRRVVSIPKEFDKTKAFRTLEESRRFRRNRGRVLAFSVAAKPDEND